MEVTKEKQKICCRAYLRGSARRHKRFVQFNPPNPINYVFSQFHSEILFDEYFIVKFYMGIYTNWEK